jgi:hypothetical protein
VIVGLPILVAIGVSTLVLTVLDRLDRRKKPTALLGVVSPKKEEK